MRDLYFLALLPPWSVARKMDDLRHDMWHRFGAQKALNSPPHITLIPTFSFEDYKHLVAQLLRFAENQPSFSIKCDGFGHFGERTLFISIEPNNALSDLQSRMQDFCRKALQLSVSGSTRRFHPHITLATKDLKRSQFAASWKWIGEVVIREEFEVEGFYLLRHSGSRWLIDRFFSFT